MDDFRDLRKPSIPPYRRAYEPFETAIYMGPPLKPQPAPIKPTIIAPLGATGGMVDMLPWAAISDAATYRARGRDNSSVHSTVRQTSASIQNRIMMFLRDHPGAHTTARIVTACQCSETALRTWVRQHPETKRSRKGRSHAYTYTSPRQ